MWFKSGSFTGLNTDAWIFNYGVGIGITQIPNGVRLAAGGMQVTDTTVSTPQLNVSDSSIISVNSSSDALRITQIGSGNALVVEDSANPDSSPFIVNSSGSVGIGLTNPSEKLEVNGRTVITTGIAPFYGLKVKDYSNSTGIYVGSVSGGNAWYIGDSYYYNSALWRTDKTAASSINFVNGSVEFYTNSGLTAGVDFTPSRKVILDVNGNLLINRSSATGTASQPLQVTGGAYVSSNLGVGVVSPGAILDVSNGASNITAIFGADSNASTRTDATNKATRIAIPHYTSSEEPAAFLFALTNSTGNSLTFGGGTALMNAATDISFYTAANSTTVTGTRALTINNQQNVAIGTDTVSARLHVVPSSTGIGALFSGTTSADMVRITQTGSGNALVVEDETNPDATPFIVTAAGSVGIGSAIPATKLDVIGDIRSSTALRTIKSQIADEGAGVLFQTTGYLRFSNGASEFIRLSSTGNLGIGTDNPATKLDVFGNAKIRTLGGTSSLTIGEGQTSNQYAVIDLVGDTTYNQSGLRIIRDNTGANASSSIYHRGTGALTLYTVESAPIEFRTSNSSYVSRYDANGNFLINSVTPTGTASQNLQVTGGAYVSGNLGVGVVSPTAKLDVDGGAASSQIVVSRFSGSASGATGNIVNVLTSNLQSGAELQAYSLSTDNTTFLNSITDAVVLRSSSTTSGGFALLTGTTAPLIFATDSTERVRITSSGNFGVNTTNPLGKLSVFTTSKNTAGAYSGNNYGIIVGADNGENLYDEGNGIVFTQQYESDGVDAAQIRVGAIVGYKGQAVGSFGGGLKFKVQPAAATAMVDAMVLSKEGYLGIGATIPGNRLHASGSGDVIRIDSSTTSCGILMYDSVLGSRIGSRSGNIIFDTNSAERVRIDSNGLVAIGLTLGSYTSYVSPRALFNVESANDASSVIIGDRTLGGANPTISFHRRTGVTANQTYGYRITELLNDLVFETATGALPGSHSWTERVRIDSTGNVGINDTSPSTRSLRLSVRLADTRYFGVYSSNSAPVYRYDDNSAPTMFLQNYGMTAIGHGMGILWQLGDSAGNASNAAGIYAQAETVWGAANATRNAYLSFHTGASGNVDERVRITSTGNVGIATNNPQYKLHVVGSFGATTKSFVVDHPTKPGKKLQYGSLESPYHGIRLTGKGMIENGKCVVELPDYISAFVKEDGINIQTTNIKHGQVLWVEEIDVENNNFTIQTEKTTGTYEFYWDFTAIRKDVPDLEVEI